MKYLVTTIFCTLLAALPVRAAAGEPPTWLVDAVNNPLRTQAEKARDINRKPLETLKFFGLQPDMRVLELMPGGGWYSKILAAALADTGQFYAAYGTDRLPKELAFTSTGGMTNRTKLDTAGYIYDIDEVSVGQGGR